MLMAPRTRKILRFCFFGDGQSSLSDRIAVFAAWCLALAILFFNAFFRLLFEDGNLLIRGVATLILAAPLWWLYSRARARCSPGDSRGRAP